MEKLVSVLDFKSSARRSACSSTRCKGIAAPVRAQMPQINLGGLDFEGPFFELNRVLDIAGFMAVFTETSAGMKLVHISFTTNLRSAARSISLPDTAKYRVSVRYTNAETVVQRSRLIEELSKLIDFQEALTLQGEETYLQV